MILGAGIVVDDSKWLYKLNVDNTLAAVMCDAEVFCSVNQYTSLNRLSQRNGLRMCGTSCPLGRFWSMSVEKWTVSFLLRFVDHLLLAFLSSWFLPCWLILQLRPLFANSGFASGVFFFGPWEWVWTQDYRVSNNCIILQTVVFLILVPNLLDASSQRFVSLTYTCVKQFYCSLCGLCRRFLCMRASQIFFSRGHHWSLSQFAMHCRIHLQFHIRSCIALRFFEFHVFRSDVIDASQLSCIVEHFFSTHVWWGVDIAWIFVNFSPDQIYLWGARGNSVNWWKQDRGPDGCRTPSTFQ